MARKAREKSGTGVYAVILKGCGKIFKKSEMRDIFCGTADKYLGKGLMGIRFFEDRAHMLVRESGRGISLDMKPLVTSFARSYNRVCKTEGKVFADRFKSVPIESPELEDECIKYLNGGETAAPYLPTKRSSAVNNTVKTAKKEPEPKAEKPAPIKEEKPVSVKPKRRGNQLPPWLL